MPNVLTCTALPPLSVGFFLGSSSINILPRRSRSVTRVLPHVVALRAAGGRHRRGRLHSPRDHQGAVLHQVRRERHELSLFEEVNTLTNQIAGENENQGTPPALLRRNWAF